MKPIKPTLSLKFTDYDLSCIEAIGKATGHETKSGAIRAALRFAAKWLEIQLPPEDGAEKNPKKTAAKP